MFYASPVKWFSWPDLPATLFFSYSEKGHGVLEKEQNLDILWSSGYIHNPKL